MDQKLFRQFLSDKMLAVLNDEMVEIDLADSSEESVMDELAVLDAIVRYVTEGQCQLCMGLNEGRLMVFTLRANSVI